MFRSNRLALAVLVVALTSFPPACNGKEGGRGESSSGGGAISGIYEAKDADGTILTIEFLGGQNARFSMSGDGENDSSDATCQINGDHIILQVPGGMPVDLMRKGDVLEGSMGGVSVMFFRK